MHPNRINQCGSGYGRAAVVAGAPLIKLEPVTGIEPAYSAWEADVLPLNYTGMLEPEG